MADQMRIPVPIARVVVRTEQGAQGRLADHSRGGAVRGAWQTIVEAAPAELEQLLAVKESFA